MYINTHTHTHTHIFKITISYLHASIVKYVKVKIIKLYINVN